MNAPVLPRRTAPGKISLTDKYERREGRIFLTGMQALVRLPLVQRWHDEAAGLDTAGFVSGYRGSPLGAYDIELMRAKAFLEKAGVAFEPGLNEELAATAIWGTQQAGLGGSGTRDGVFGIWYGKGPGLDRAMDVMKHGSFAGSSPQGGVLAIVGDDHGCKSSTMPHQNDHNFMAAFMPFLYPADVHEFVEYGLLGIAMSRYSGCWVGMKLTSETADTSATVDLAREARTILLPQDFELPEDGVHIRWPDEPRLMDVRQQRIKGFAAMAFARANGINYLVWDAPDPKFGIIASGKSYQDVREALRTLGIDEERAKAIGLRLYKVGMPWPLEPHGVRHFCGGLQEVLVVEEKREMIEHQLKWQLFNWKPDVRPLVVGKHDEGERWLLPAENDLDVSLIARVIAERLARRTHLPDIEAQLRWFLDREAELKTYEAPTQRTAFYCSGCPHNRSTLVPDGSKALGGIGCHYMATRMDRATETVSAMGGEGVTWIGRHRYSKDRHIFANLGDGTYQHSGILAIRAALAAGVNITYKILFNDAVAMTGGQPVEGTLTVPQIARQLQAEGVTRIAVLTEDVKRYPEDVLPAGVTLHDRRELMMVQRAFREETGCTVIIYDQTCAAEKRRRRKRGKMPEPATRVFINEEVCEGCGDCSAQSSCLSIEPVETAFGRKRRINQSSCNKDYSCLDGFCPAFVTLEGVAPRKEAQTDGWRAALAGLPEPKLPPLEGPWNILVTGVGGTGVLTIGALMGMAAHLEGKASHILDMSGLAQKGGPVMSHVRLGAHDGQIRSGRIMTGSADVLLACDAVVAASPEALKTLSRGRTRAAVNLDQMPVAAFVTDPDADFRKAAVLKEIAHHVADRPGGLPAAELAERVLGDAIAANMILLGYAWQRGLVPLSRPALHQAVELNAVAVEQNLDAFELGRLMAHAPEKLKPFFTPETPPVMNLDTLIAHRMAHLAAYQNAAYARRYLMLVGRVRDAESRVAGEAGPLARAAARNYAKLLAYKDEYEVARLYTDGAFARSLARQFAGAPKITLHLSPMGSPLDPATGRPAKRAFAGWLMMPALKALARLRGLRGTWADPFSYQKDRQEERALIGWYGRLVHEVLAGLVPETRGMAVEILSLPDKIRGFGPLKLESAAIARAEAEEMLARFHAHAEKSSGQRLENAPL